jgi:hypothetical protein
MAQGASTPQPPIHLTSEQDHQRTMDALGITSLRHGVENNLTSQYPVNYDEAKGNADAKLPDPLVLNDGKPVTTAKMWWTKRRPEIMELFDREVYGRTPAHTPKVTWEVTGTKHETVGDVAVIAKEVAGHVDNSLYPQITVNIPMTLTLPENAKGPVPVIVEFTFDPEFMAALVKRGVKLPPTPPGPTWQQQILAKGWGYAVLIPTKYQADNGEGLTQGIIGLVNKGQPRKMDDWGTLKAWAWGASRALDYFETDKSVNAKEVVISGHSRYGKAALVTMAYDQRFSIAYVSSSGAGGAQLYRRNFGERPENVAATNEYHWMAGNFLKYAGPLTANDLPVDSHELIALCAGRPVFIGAGAGGPEGDGWADAKGMFLAEVGAGPVYKLLEKKDLGTTQMPAVGTALIDGDLGFRQHSDGHTPLPNWPTFLDFAGHYFKTPQ